MTLGRITLAAVLGPLAAVLAGLTAGWPLWRAGYYAGHDGIAHLYRVAVLAEEIRRGNLYPRWAPDLAQGYGYPVFHFYGPLSHYLAWLMTLTGLALPEAVKTVYGLSFVGCALGMVLFARTLLPRSGAALAAAAYALAPYLLSDVYVRGAFGEAVAFTWYPLLFWGVRRIAHGQRHGVLVTAITTALAVVTYNPLALFGLPLAVAYGVWVCWRRMPRIAGALAIGLALSAWFWLPALIDSSVVTIGNLGYARENFLAPDQIVQSSLTYRHEVFPFSLGLVQVLLALAGTALIVRSPLRRELAFFPVAGLVLTILISTPAAPLWDVVPLIKLIAYPWRLLGFVAFCLAVPIGLLASLGRWQPFVAGAIGVLIAGTSVTQTLPDPAPIEAVDITPAGWLRREANLGILGTTTGAEYLPRWSAAGPGAADSTPRDEGSGTITAARLESADASGVRVRVALREAAPIRLHQFAFPGWTATIDGATVPAAPETPLGLLTARVPAGDHVVGFRFGASPQVIAGWLLAAAGLAALVVARPRLARIGAAALLIGLPQPTAPTARPIGSLQPVAPSAVVPVGQQLAPNLWLLGATVDPRGETIAVRLYWLADRPPAREQKIVLSLSDWIVRESQPRYGVEWISDWRSNEIVEDPVWFRLPPGVTAGSYPLRIRVGDGPMVDLGQVPVASTIGLEETAASVSFGGQVALDRAFLHRDGRQITTARPGEDIALDLTWRAIRVPDEDYITFVHLYGSDGRRWLQDDRRPAGDLTAFTTYDPGVTVNDRRRYQLPLDLPPGDYRVEVGLYVQGGDRLPTADGTTAVAARVRVP